MRDEILDVVIVGGGFAGSALAATLSARGFRIAICDPHDVHPADFRAEKLAIDQMEALGRLGLLAPALRAATPIGFLRVARGGRIVDAQPSAEYAFDYRALVHALREASATTDWIRRRVESVESADGVQMVKLHGAPALKARLVVLATGIALSLRKSLGLDRVTLSENHSLSIGFDLKVDPSRPAGQALTYFGERVSDRIGYLTLFPIEDRLRANLFVYWNASEKRARDFRADPERALDAAMPALRQMLPPFTIPDTPVLRPIHLYGPPEQTREGIVLIGDAYSTTCPAGGGGLTKALVDIDLVSEILPRWLAQSRGISRADIAEFYLHPLKVASEARRRRAAEISRASAIDPGLFWEARRRRNYYGMQVNSWLRRRLGVTLVGPARATM